MASLPSLITWRVSLKLWPIFYKCRFRSLKIIVNLKCRQLTAIISDHDIFRNEREVANENPTWSLQQEKLCICWAKKPTIVATGERHKFYLFSSPKPFYRSRALSWPCSTATRLYYRSSQDFPWCHLLEWFRKILRTLRC